MKKEFILLLLSTLLMLVLCVFILEFFFQKQDWQDTTIQFDSHLGWSNKPSNSLIIGGKVYSVNAMGFRSEKVDPLKDHILLVGDSVTFGHGVNDDETLTFFLGEKYKGYQVLNLGVNGYGVGQYFLNLRRHIEKLNPKFIIVNICTGNDLGDTISNFGYGKSKPLFTIDPEKLKISPGREYSVNPENLKLVNSEISRYSCANLTTARIRKNWFIDFAPLRNRICPPKTLNDMEAQYVLMALVMKMSQLAKKHQAGLMFVLSPHRGDFNLAKPSSQESYTGHLNYFEGLLLQMKYRYMNYLEIVKNQNADVDDSYLDELHYSASGNRKLSEAIYQYIESRSSIKKPN